MTDTAPDTAKAPAKAVKKADPKAHDAPLVQMTRTGEVLYVHPTCVAAHVRAGWREA